MQMLRSEFDAGTMTLAMKVKTESSAIMVLRM
jgi:hypothetical protein